MAEGIDLGLSGLASGFDWKTLVDQLVEVERTPQVRMFTEQQSILTRKTAYDSVATQLSVLQNRVDDLNDSDLFDSRLATSSDEDIATVSAAAGAALGTYKINISQLATAAVQLGSTNIGGSLSATSDVSGVVLEDASFSRAITAGTFTVNGKQVTISADDTLQEVFDAISTATSGDVVGSYDPITDKISLTSASDSTIVLGSATDSSNFLSVMRLSNNGTDTVTSSSSLGSANLSATLTGANLGTTISDGGGTGKFKINGVEITFDDATDTISDVLSRINSSDAGVTASYDTVNDRFLLTNKITGDMGIALEDVTGNFLAATGLTTGTLDRGDDLHYRINDGGVLTSHSNTITEDSSGIEGLSIAVVDSGETTVTVSSDTDAISKVITDFIDAYNKAQAIIDTNTASTTDATGKVTAGTLAAESEAYSIASDLRRMVTATFSSLTGTIKRLEGLGIATNGDNNNLSLSDSDKLEEALANNLSEVKSLFTNSTDGLAVQLAAYLENTVGDDGTLPAKQDNLDTQVQSLTDQINDQERLVQSNREQLIATFVAMETAQQNINQQLQYLSRINAG
ncbi:MAG: flagellar filament capping protein FliD [Verrucomicrobia bacterium]|nr:flagellar filament capping protein FliD [Verrucomicrobiota bacterium]